MTPLIVTRFDEAEIAAWYLFSSLLFFNQLLVARVGITFSRMIAFAMGGASDLSPINFEGKARGDGKPNWAALERAFSTLSTLQTALAVVAILFMTVGGLFVLPNLVNGTPSESSVFWAFSVFVFTSLITSIFARYQVALKGMNHVSLINRWQMLMNLLSVIAGSISLLVAPSILTLTICMQVFLLLGCVVSRFLLMRVEGGVISRFSQEGFDFEVFGWAWPPLWKGFIIQLADSGAIQIGAIAFSRIGNLSDVASYLFTLRLVQSAVNISRAPLGSIQPRFGKLIASGEISKLRALNRTRINISQCILGGFLLLLILFGDPALSLLNANVQLMHGAPLLLLCILILYQWFVNYSGTICGVGNQIILVWSSVGSALLTVVLMYALPSYWGIVGVMCATWLPRIILLNIRPSFYAAKMLACSRFNYVKEVYWGTLVMTVAIVGAYLFT